MSETYTKLFTSITASTVWQEPAGTRLTWITMLAMADKNGDVFASIPGLARIANVSIPEVEVALKCFLSPDPYSRTKDHDGRRIAEIDGGWRLLNHGKFRALREEDERAAYKREWDRKNRPSGHARKSDSPTAVRRQSDSPTGSDPSDQTIPTPDQEQEPSSLRSDSSAPLALTSEPADLKSRRAARIRQIAEDARGAYNATLAKPHGVLSACAVLNAPRLKAVEKSLPTARAMCKTLYGSEVVTPDFWREYFEEVAKDDWHSGRKCGGPGHENWKPDFEYLLREGVMAKLFDRAMTEAA